MLQKLVLLVGGGAVVHWTLNCATVKGNITTSFPLICILFHCNFQLRCCAKQIVSFFLPSVQNDRCTKNSSL